MSGVPGDLVILPPEKHSGAETPILADAKRKEVKMNVGSVSGFSNYLIEQATAMKSGAVHQSIQTAVLKQTMDQQQTEAQALVQMIESTSLSVSGSHIDLRV